MTRPPFPGWGHGLTDGQGRWRTVRRRAESWIGRHSRVGLLVAAFAYVASFSPSLLPRTWLTQSLLTAVTVAVMYGVGAALGAAWDLIARGIRLEIGVAPWVRRWLGPLVAGLVVVWMAVSLRRSYHAAAVTAELVEMAPPAWWEHSASLFLALVFAWLVRLVFVTLRRAWRRLRAATRRRIRFPFLDTAVAIAVVLGLVVVFNQVVARNVLGFFYEHFARANVGVEAGAVRPTQAERSGSPASSQDWEQLGRMGQSFLTLGPSATQITQVTGRPAREPIRIYAGLIQHQTIDDAVAAVLGELERTGAWERDCLLLVTTTGSGWVDEYSVQAVEYLSGGDVATVAIQYSFLPSFAALLSDRESPQLAARQLLTAVEERLAARPAGQRPALLATGTSLGAYGGLGAFASAADMLARVDGAVWTGVPRWTPLHRELTAGRQKGSPEVAPVIGSGEHIRFITKPAQLRADAYGRAYIPWSQPRVVFLQHASDPVVWWEPHVFVAAPTWIREAAGSDVNPAMRWTWGVTFWQLFTDLPFAGLAPAGHGHFYRHEQIHAWREVLAPAGQAPLAGRRVSEETIERIAQHIDADLLRTATGRSQLSH